MLYLEDYLEMIEHLPQELRDRFTEMRELDLTVQNNMDELEKRVRNFFSDCRRNGSAENMPQSIKTEFEAIGAEYRKTLEDADEKTHLANQMYELVDKYLRRLDNELHKFKCELEADNKGITEVLEKRSLELDSSASMPSMSSQQKENRYESGSTSSFRYRQRNEKRRDSSNSIQNSYSEKRQNVSGAMPLGETRHSSSSGATLPSLQLQQQQQQQQNLIQQQNSQMQPQQQQQQQQIQQSVTSSSAQGNVNYNLGHIGAGPAIAAAASQAIAATQQMQQGRRTASLKASYEAINTAGNHGHEFSIGRELAGAAQTAIQAIQQDHVNNKKKQKRWTASSSTSTTTPSSSTSSTTSISSNNHNSTTTHHTTIPPISSSSSNHHHLQHHNHNYHQQQQHQQQHHHHHQQHHNQTHHHQLHHQHHQIQNVLNTPSITSTSNNNNINNTNNSNNNNNINNNSSISNTNNNNAPVSPSIDVSSQSAEVTDGEWTYDPNEPRYCLCNQVSYGDMVACDNEDCPTEWFHYPCVGISAPPKGKWYCPQCTASMKRRGGRKN